MKKIIAILSLTLISVLGYSQSSRFRVQNDTKFGWTNKTVPVKTYSDSTWFSVLFKGDIPNFANGFWGLQGNALGNNTSFLGSTDNRSVSFKSNNIEFLKGDSTKNMYARGTFINGNGPSTNTLGIDLGVVKLTGNSVIGARTYTSSGFAEYYMEADEATKYSGWLFTGSTYAPFGLFRPSTSIMDMQIDHFVILNESTTGDIILANAGNGLSTERFRIGPNGNIGISGNSSTKTATNVTSYLKLAPGNLYSPLGFTSGALTTGTNVIAGNVEFLTDDYYLTITTAVARQKIERILTGSATLNFPNTTAQTANSLTLTVTGAVDGDAVIVGSLNAANDATNTIYSAWVSAADVVTIKFANNNLGTAFDPPSSVFKVTVTKN